MNYLTYGISLGSNVVAFLRHCRVITLNWLPILLISATSVIAADRPPEMTAFSDWKARFEATADGSAKPSLVAEGVVAARHRRAALRELIKNDPQAALEFSRSLTNSEKLPPQVRAELESHFSTNGDFIVQCAFPSLKDPHFEPLRRFIRIGGTKYRAYPTGGYLGGVSRTNVLLQGIMAEGVAALDGGSASTPVEQPNPPSAWTTGAKNVIVIRVDFSDLPGAPEGYADSDILNIANNQIVPYYAKSSYGATSLNFTVTSNVYRLPQTASSYATGDANDTLHSDAESAASADYAVSGYDRIIVLFASLGGIQSSQITYGGLAQIGGKDVWCNGEFDFRVIAHELGHTYGLYHGNLWQVSDGNPISTSGVDTEYGDDFDTMGSNFANDHNTDFCPWFKNLLGWVADAQVLTVTNSGTYRVYAFDHGNYVTAPSQTNLALKIVKNSTYNYWVSCRGNFTNNPTMSNGVYVQWGYNYTRQSDLLDLNTPGNSDSDAGLFFGSTFTDTAAAGLQGLSIQPLDRGGADPNEYRDVKITFGVAPPLAPTFVTQPSSASGVLGGTVFFSANANGNPTPGFYWQRQPAGSSGWQNLSDGGIYTGTTTSTLTVSLAALTMSGDQFQCVAGNSAGFATSSPVVLTVSSALYVSTIAGQATVGGTSNGTGTNALFFYPWDLVCDNAGNVYIAQYYNGQVRKMTPSGVVTTYASGFSGPQGLAIDAHTNIYVSDSSHQQIKVVPFGATKATVLAGTANVSGSQDGTNTSATFSSPWGIAVDSQTNIYVADNYSNIIRRLTRSGTNWVVTTIAGSPGVTGSNDGTNSQASFNSPASLACDASNNIYVADSYNYTVRKITPDSTGTIFTVSTFAGQAGNYGDRNGIRTNATLGFPYGLGFDAAGNLYITDGANNNIRIISTNGMVSTLAGFAQTVNGGPSYGSSDGYNTAASFNGPYGIAVDKFGDIYIADTFNYTIRVAHAAQVTVPTLALNLSGSNSILTWSEPTQPYHLQANTDLTTTNWINVTNANSTIGALNVTTNATSGQAVYYRLVNP